MNVGTRQTRSGSLDHIKTLADLVAEFEVSFNYKAGVERSEGSHDPVVDYCKEAATLSTAIARAVDGKRRDGKMFSEGSCIAKEAKSEFFSKLLSRVGKIAKAKDFDVLHDLVQSLAVKGIGNLTVYNVTARIAAWKGLEPVNFVYVHAGPLKGWKRLSNSKGNPVRVPVKQLPPELRKLSPHRVEDFLCEYSEFLHPGLIERCLASR